MPTLQNKPNLRPEGIGPAEDRVEVGMRRLAPSLARVAEETAAAFFCAEASRETGRSAPHIPESDRMQCSQRNAGGGFELLCNLTADRGEYGRLFPAGVPDSIKMDAYCELANCICGSVLADGAFLDEFGYMVPSVPCSGPARLAAGSRTVRGAFSLAGAWIHFAFAVSEAREGGEPL